MTEESQAAEGKSGLSCTAMVVIAVIAVVVIFATGRLMGTVESVNSLFWVPFLVAAVLTVMYFILRRRTPSAVEREVRCGLDDIHDKYRQQRTELVKAYDAEAQPIKEKYRSKGGDKAAYQAKLDQLRPKYIALEKPILEGCERDEKNYIEKVCQENAIKPGWMPESVWSYLIAVPAVIIITFAAYGIGALRYDKATDSNNTTGWSVDNLEMVHLQDENRYVCNPDHVLSDEAVANMDTKLAQLERDYGIESVVVVVNHIAGDDPFQLTQDIFRRYGVGRDDRGLVIAIGYRDHSAFIATGRNLEADLTDAECNRLQTDYFDAFAKAGMIDEAMMSLVSAIVHRLSDGRMPRVTGDVEAPRSAENIFYSNLLWWGLLFAVWVVVCLMLLQPLYDDRLKSLRSHGLLEGPWHNDSVTRSLKQRDELLSDRSYDHNDDYDSYSSSSSSSWSSSSSSWHSSGGSFSGGSSGGGGGGHRW